MYSVHVCVCGICVWYVCVVCVYVFVRGICVQYVCVVCVCNMCVGVCIIYICEWNFKGRNWTEKWKIISKDM